MVRTEEPRMTLVPVQRRCGPVRMSQFPGPGQVHSAFGDVETLLSRPMLPAVAQVPLAEITRRVAVLLEGLGNGLFAQFQVIGDMFGIALRRYQISRDAGSCGILAREDGGPGGRANRPGSVEVRKEHAPAGSQPINVRGLVRRAAVITAQVAPSQIVDQYEHYVGSAPTLNSSCEDESCR